MVQLHHERNVEAVSGFGIGRPQIDASFPRKLESIAVGLLDARFRGHGGVMRSKGALFEA